MAIDIYTGKIYWIAGALAATIAAALLLRSQNCRKLRGFFLLASVAVFGFYRGACPCPIMGIQESVLLFSGSNLHPGRLFGFLALLPVTYFAGKVWCGWVCHLGALQELIHRPGRFNFLNSAKALRTMKVVRIVLLVILILQLVITKSILWDQIDPFKAAFNLSVPNYIAWVLLVALLISSVLVFRPFCKSVCPVGLVLGWVGRIPGASLINVKSTCVGCKPCVEACQYGAIKKEVKKVNFHKEECLSCGECIDTCKLQAMSFGNNSDLDSVVSFYDPQSKK